MTCLCVTQEAASCLLAELRRKNKIQEFLDLLQRRKLCSGIYEPDLLPYGKLLDCVNQPLKLFLVSWERWAVSIVS